MKQLINILSFIVIISISSCDITGETESPPEEQETEMSSDATLNYLNCTEGTLSPTFSPDIYEYTLSLNYNVSNFQLRAQVNDNKAVILSGTGYKTPVDYETITILIEAEDDTQKEYKVTIDKEEEPAPSLTSLSISDGTLDPAFSPSVYSYTAEVDNSITSLTFTGAAEEGFSITYPTSAVHLNVGDNTIEVKVQCDDDQNFTTDYEIVVTRKASNDSSLQYFAIKNYEISPEFSADITDYTLTVPYGTGSVSLLYKTADSSAIESTGESSSYYLRIENTYTYVRKLICPLNDEQTTQTGVTIVSADGSSETTYNLTVTEDDPKGSFQIYFSSLNNETITASLSDYYGLYRDDTLVVRVYGNYDAFHWYMDGTEIIADYFNPELKYGLSDLGKGQHTLLVVIELDGTLYSTQKHFYIND